jgi:hypothetical protein
MFCAAYTFVTTTSISSIFGTIVGFFVFFIKVGIVCVVAFYTLKYVVRFLKTPLSIIWQAVKSCFSWADSTIDGMCDFLSTLYENNCPAIKIVDKKK